MASCRCERWLRPPGLHLLLGDALDQAFLALPVGDQFGNRNGFQSVGLSKCGNFTPAHHRTVLVHQFRDHADGRQVDKAAQIDGSLGMARTHQHTTFLGNQRKDVAGPYEIAGPGIWIGKGPAGRCALFCGYSGCRVMAVIDRHRKGGGMRCVVFGHHRRKVQPLGVGKGHRCADNAGGVADDERHFLGGAVNGGDDQVALVFSVIVIGDDNDFAGLERTQRVSNFYLVECHACFFLKTVSYTRPVWPRCNR